MSLNGIDISGWQEGIDISALPDDCAFVIVKATGGTGFVNDDWERQVNQTLECGKLLGIYHYAYEKGYEGSAHEEAMHFLDHVRKYKGQFVPALDVEANALDLDPEWYKEWMDTVAEELGSNCLLYTGASFINSNDLDIVSDRPLWMTSYLYKYFYSDGFIANPDNIWDSGDWDEIAVYQYSGTGRLDGYDGDLDLDIFYGSREDWERMCGMASQNPGAAFNNAGMNYQAHEQNHGWLDWVHDGQAAGITGESLRLEGLHIDPPEGWELEVAVHMQGIGWKLYTGIVHGNDILIGSTGESRRIEMFGIRVVKKPVGADDLFFQVHQQNVGWKPWTKEGFFSGSDAESCRLEAIRIRIGK